MIQTGSFLRNKVKEKAGSASALLFQFSTFLCLFGLIVFDFVGYRAFLRAFSAAKSNH